jgi:hypothetical protein
MSEPTAPCVDCGKQVTLNEIEFRSDPRWEPCPAQDQSGVNWGHRVSRNDYEAVLGGRI